MMESGNLFAKYKGPQNVCLRSVGNCEKESLQISETLIQALKIKLIT